MNKPNKQIIAIKKNKKSIIKKIIFIQIFTNKYYNKVEPIKLLQQKK